MSRRTLGTTLGLTYLTAILLLVAAACAPVQDGVQRAVRAVAAHDDGAQLVIHGQGVTFDPAGEIALEVVLYVGGQDLVENEDACEPLRNGVACYLGDVSTPATVSVTGENRSANVSYYRPGPDLQIRFFYVRE
jgi:hypothetical protein